MIAPAPPGTVAAIRSVTSSPDPTGSVRQIMSILGRSMPQLAEASEIIMRLPDESIKTNVQPPASLSVGEKAAITTGPDATIQPYPPP